MAVAYEGRAGNRRPKAGIRTVLLGRLFASRIYRTKLNTSFTMRQLSLISLVAQVLLASGNPICPPTGPILPSPHIPRDYDLFNLTHTLDRFIQNAVEDGWNSTVNSFSVMATSAEETFFSYHHTAPLKNQSGVHHVDGDTVYAIASITKVLTVLAVWLEDKMNLDDPIGRYVHELNNSDWADVTLRLLTSQIAAIPRNGTVPCISAKKSAKPNKDILLIMS
jgi:CubicO group peptidase (beta-lactamase class C family)